MLIMVKYMLEEMEILNGELSLKFDYLNTKYTVMVDSTVSKLDLNLKVRDDCEISIFNNNNLVNNSVVVVTVYNDEEMISYYLEIYKKREERVFESEDYFASLEVNTKQEVPDYVAPLLACSCFLIILFLFTFLFKKNKSVNRSKL